MLAKVLLKYLWYVLRHKWYVFLECCRLGIPWLGITHDLSKFLPDEFWPYAMHFYGDIHRGRDGTGYYKAGMSKDACFDFAWMLHQKRNRHHWQWWMLPIDRRSQRVLPMPDRYRREMLADWRGAGQAQGTPDTQAWYRAHRNDIVLHHATRAWIEEQLGLGRSNGR